MLGRKDSKKVIQMKRRHSKATGAFLILFAIYVLFLGFQSATKEHVSIYEVTEKKISDDNLVRGIIIRNEKLVTSSQSGYINYYVADGTKVGAKTRIYSIDQTGQIFDQISDIQTDSITLSKQNTSDIRSEIAAYRDSCDLSHFEEIYQFKYNIDNTVSELTNAQLLDNVTRILRKNGSDESFQFGSAGESGVISYTSDGLENLSMNDISSKTFENTSEQQQQLRKTESVEAETPIYRLVTNESWSVVFPLTEEQFKNIQQESKLTITLKRIQAKVAPQVTTFTMDGGYYAKIDLKRYMIQYINNRYLDLEIEMSDEAGLKIPKSSVIQKSFYKLDQNYITQDQKGNSGVIVVSYQKDGTPVYEHHSMMVLSFPEEEDSEDSSQEEETAEQEQKTTYCYIPADELEPGTSIVRDNMGSEKFQLAATEKLDGVFCCNKGYCEFRPVEIAYKNNEYCIIRKDTVNGLSAYDHIILNPDLIRENDIIH